MLATAERPILNQAPPGEKEIILRGLVATNFRLLKESRFPNKTIPASVGGRYDDEHFKDMVWSRDMVHAVQSALDPDFKQAFPHLVNGAQSLYLEGMQALLEIQTSPEQIQRFKARPSFPDKDGYCSLGDQEAPAIKFFGPNGSIVREWGHHQPDTWGILLLEAGKGIQQGLPLLEAEKFKPGEVLANITSYTANLKVERLKCRSIWERDHLKSPYSTRRIVLAGLEQMLEVWDQIQQDSLSKNYPLPIQEKEILTAAKDLRGLVRENAGDYTDADHPFAEDLAQLVVLNEVDLPVDEQAAIIKAVAVGELENNLGCYRWIGDTWKKEGTEAKWTMGKSFIARYYLKRARLLAKTDTAASHRYLDHGLDRIQHVLNIMDYYKYLPELFKYGPKSMTYRPNNNDHAWGRSALIAAASSGICALQTLKEAT